jgi:HSP20 family protein
MATQQSPQQPQQSPAMTPARNSQSAAAPAQRTDHRPAVAPPVDVYENPNELLVIADMPGVTLENTSIHFERNRLTIAGRRSQSKAAPLLAENDQADFRRTFLVPQGIDAEHISAELSQGVLKVHLPKHASVKPRRIEVKPS